MVDRCGYASGGNVDPDVFKVGYSVIVEFVSEEPSRDTIYGMTGTSAAFPRCPETGGYGGKPCI
jgi:hypothetical protein